MGESVTAMFRWKNCSQGVVFCDKAFLLSKKAILFCKSKQMLHHHSIRAALSGRESLKLKIPVKVMPC